MIIYRLGSLGDTIVALPSLKLIARAFPQEKRIMLTHFSVNSKAAPMAEILENTNLISEYVEYPLKLRNPFAIWVLFRRIRNLHQKTLVYLTPPRGRLSIFRDALFFKACGIKKIIGAPFSANQQNLLALGEDRYEYEGARLLRCLRDLGTQPLDSQSSFDLLLTDQEKTTAQLHLEFLGDAPVIAICVGTKADVNDWGQDNWRRLVARLTDMMPGWALILLGANADKDRSQDLASLWRGPVLNLCGAIPVRISGAILQHCKIYVGHDSGPLHLAASVGTPCVAIFSSRNPAGKWFPPGKIHKIFYTYIECSGCMLTECEKLKKVCIMSITVEEVFDAVIEITFAVNPSKMIKQH